MPLEQYLSDNPLDVTNYIIQNFDCFVDAYNASEYESWNASYVENYFPITIGYLGNDINGYFLDFDGENGYAVLGEKYQFYDFSISGESPYKDYSGESYYYSNGLYYYLGDNVLSSVTNKTTNDV